MTDKTAVEAMARGIWEIGAADDIDRLGSQHYAQAALDAYHEWLKADGLAVVPVEVLLPFSIACNRTSRAIDTKVSGFDPIHITVTKRQFLDLSHFAITAAAQGGE